MVSRYALLSLVHNIRSTLRCIALRRDATFVNHNITIILNFITKINDVNEACGQERAWFYVGVPKINGHGQMSQFQLFKTWQLCQSLLSTFIC